MIGFGGPTALPTTMTIMGNRRRWPRRILLRPSRHAMMFLVYLMILSQWSSIALLSSASSVSYIVDVDPYDEECYRIRTPKTTAAAADVGGDPSGSLRLLSGDYELVAESGGPVSAEPLLVYIMEANEKEKIVWRSVGQNSGTFRVGVKAGGFGYWFCIQNSSHAPDAKGNEAEHPDHKRRLVGFSLNLTPFAANDQKPAPLAIFTADHHWDWMEKASWVQSELMALTHHHDYLRMREAAHRVVVEATFSGVLFWTIVEATLVICLAVGQVMYFRNFLEKKRSFMM